MAIRGPHGPKPPPPEAGVRPARQQAVSPLQRLVDFGAARTPQEARRVVNELVASLRAAGFPVSATGSAEGQLGQALKLFQQSQGLPADGRIDRDTLGALLDAGLLPVGAREGGETGRAGDAGEAGRTKETPQGPERMPGLPRFLGEKRALPQTGGDMPAGAKAAHDVEASQKASAKDKPPEVDLKSFLSSLRSAGFFGAGKGALQLKDALQKVQRAEGLPTNGQLDARTVEALVRREVLPQEALATLARENASSQSASTTARSESTQAQADPTARGLPEGQGDPDATVGRGDGVGSAAGRAGQGGDGTGTQHGAPVGAAGPAVEGEAVPDALHDDEAGNAPAGDDDLDDERRGHASLDDDRDTGSDQEVGYWEAPVLAEQIRAGLDAIVRDDDGAGAATYAWDFTLYRPGVYGAKQPAERLFHLVVERAGPFDGLWEQARAALNDKLAALEPETRALVAEDFERALRRARVRTSEER